MAELKIKVGADVSQAVQGLQQIENKMKQTSSAGQNFSKGIEASTKALQKVPQTSSAATQSLVNLSRVAEDAPFGFIGIANNINPLLESFQRLKVSTGTTGGAFKELGKSLIGPAGLGLAVGVVSSLLVVFGDKLFGTSKAAKEAKEANDKLAEGLSNDIVKLTSIVAVIQNVNTSQEDRVKALRAINDQYSKYLPSLGKEEITLKNIAESYDRIVKSLVRQAVVKGLQEEIANSIKETASQIIALEKQEAIRRQQSEQNTKQTQQQLRANRSLSDEISRYNNTVKDGSIAIRGQNAEQLKVIGGLNNYESAITRLEAQLRRKLEPLFGIINQFTLGDLDIKIPEPKLTKADEDTYWYYTIGITKDQLKAEAPRIGAEINRVLETAIRPKSFLGEEAFKVNEKALNALREKLQVLGDVALTVGSVFSSAFDGLFQALVQGGNAIQAFGQAFIQALTGVISKLIQTAILAAIVSALGGGVGIGAASNKFGDIFKVLSGFGGFRANGGPVEAGKTYAVGERGMELFTPSVSGRIIPNNQIGGISTGGRSSGGGAIVLRGRELRLLGVRTTNSQIRLGVRA